ncbi:hypothetical protein PRIO_0606 [Paenibacillus riograndensis SBR5]|uniref:Uncharacterized protein n=1 Tax=Paenibacillus riograndensis SBR5 TaxID=1073571 RepID=A0A0E3WG74_9BACL|nr:hypothetical protein PRIO_0606 [Paenibacillus riograndensis SBR5]
MHTPFLIHPDDRAGQWQHQTSYKKITRESAGSYPIMAWAAKYFFVPPKGYAVPAGHCSPSSTGYSQKLSLPFAGMGRASAVTSSSFQA